MRRLLLCTALLAVGAAGCGGSRNATETGSRKLPSSLAQAWATRADAIATAVSEGHGCRAQRLADSLRDAVVNAQARLPVGFRATLLTSVNELADRITCTPPPETVTAPAPTPPHREHRAKGHERDRGEHG